MAAPVELLVEELDIYLSPGIHKAAFSVEGFLPDPRFDRVRNHPLFQELVAKYRRP